MEEGIVQLKEVVRKYKEDQKPLFRELVKELNGKTMDYETCRMLEDFFNDYSTVVFDKLIVALEEMIAKKKKEASD